MADAIHRWPPNSLHPMIIWSGHGILIPISAIIGVLLGGAGGGAIGRATGASPQGMVALATMGSGAGMVAMLWLYALTLGRTVDQTLIDPATRRPVILRKRHTFFFVSAFLWAVLGTIGGVLWVGSGIMQWTSGED